MKDIIVYENNQGVNFSISGENNDYHVFADNVEILETHDASEAILCFDTIKEYNRTDIHFLSLSTEQRKQAARF